MWIELSKQEIDRNYVETTEAMDVPGVGVVLRVTAESLGTEGTWHPALSTVFIPGATIQKIGEHGGGQRAVLDYAIVPIQSIAAEPAAPEPKVTGKKKQDPSEA